MRNVAVLVTVALSTAASQSFGRFTYAVLLTDIRDELGLSNTLAGSLGSANLAAYLVGTLVVSLVLGRRGLVTVARFGLGGVAVGLGALAWSPNAAVVTGGLLLTGFAASGVWITAPALAAAELSAERRGVAIGMVGAGLGIGIILAAWFDHLVSWRGVYRLEALLTVVTLVLLVSLVGSLPVSTTPTSGLATIRGIPGWKPLLGLYGLFALGMSLVMTFTVALLEDDAGYSPSRAAFAFSLIGVATLAGGPLAGMVADRYGRRTALGVAFALMAVSASIIATGHRPGATIAAFGFGLAFTAVPVAVSARIVDFAQGEDFGAAFGVATLAFGLGLMIGPQLGGALSDASGSFRAAFAVAVVAALGGAACTRAATEVPSGAGTVSP
mgnify:CR=1 FL=1|jgi:predicted MFS family arabinose efflux permease